MLAASLLGVLLLGSVGASQSITPLLIPTDNTTLNFDAAIRKGPKLSVDLFRAVFVSKNFVYGYQLSESQPDEIRYNVNEAICDADLSRNGTKVAALLAKDPKTTFAVFDWGNGSRITPDETSPSALNKGIDFWRIAENGNFVATQGKTIAGWQSQASSTANVDSDFACELGISGFDLNDSLYAYVRKSSAAPSTSISSPFTIRVRSFASSASADITLSEKPCKINWREYPEPTLKTSTLQNFDLVVTFENYAALYNVTLSTSTVKAFAEDVDVVAAKIQESDVEVKASVDNFSELATSNVEKIIKATLQQTISIGSEITAAPLLPAESIATYAYEWGVIEVDACSDKTRILFRETPFFDSQNITLYSIDKKANNTAWQFVVAYPVPLSPSPYPGRYLLGKVDRCDDRIESFTYVYATSP